jgi:3-oxoacyl-[acyl-carrier protein] reductase
MNAAQIGTRLNGRVALITGGSRGIGAAIVRAFAAEGCEVAFCHVGDEGRAGHIVSEVEAVGCRVYAAPCDVVDETAVIGFVSDVRRRLGHVDILVNNAGISGELPFECITPAIFDRMIAVHLRGTFLMTWACYPEMKARGSGRIINITSQLAYKGAPGLVHYCAAKAGIVGLTRALSREAAPHGVLVNAIAPGPIETDLMAELSDSWKESKRQELPLRRFGTPEEIAPTAVLLASEDGDYYVGQTLSPNGGDVML